MYIYIYIYIYTLIRAPPSANAVVGKSHQRLWTHPLCHVGRPRLALHLFLFPFPAACLRFLLDCFPFCSMATSAPARSATDALAVTNGPQL